MLRSDDIYLEIRYEDSLDVAKIYEDCDISDMVQCLNAMSNLKQIDWTIVADTDTHKTDNYEVCKVNLKCVARDSNLWCMYSFLFRRDWR